MPVQCLLPQEQRLDFTSPPAFIYLHARNICEVGDDVFAVSLSNRSRAAQILVHPMLESLFSLAAAAKNPAFPAKKIVAEQEDQIKRFKSGSRRITMMSFETG